MRIELFCPAPKNSDTTPRFIDSVKAMTSDPPDAGSLVIRRTDLGLPGAVALFKFLASIIVLSKKHRVLAAAHQGYTKVGGSAPGSPAQPRNFQTRSDAATSKAPPAGIDNAPGLFLVSLLSKRLHSNTAMKLEAARTAMIRVSHDYLDPGFIADPYPYFKKIRNEMPVHWNERWRGWIVTRYDDVYAALHNDRLMADTVTPYFQAMEPQDREKYALIYDVLNNWTVFIDPPKHTRLPPPDAAGVHPARDREDA